MPIPRQAQMPSPTVREVAAAVIQRAFELVAQAFNRVPVFATYRRVVDVEDSGLTNTMTSSTFIDVDLVTGGKVLMRVRKFEQWTAFDVNFVGTAGLTLFDADTSIEFRVVAVDVASGAVTTGGTVGKVMWDYVDATDFEHPGSHKTIAGSYRFTPSLLGPGVYDIKLQWRIGGNGTAFVNTADFFRLTGCEVIPPDPKDITT